MDMPVHWGCEPTLPPGTLHLVVSTERMEMRRLSQWLPHVGLANAHIYVYYRTKMIVQPVYKLPCNMTLFTRLLEPNMGREASVFFSHVTEFYEAAKPTVFAFAHSHGPLSHHSRCGAFFRRLRRVQRDLATTNRGPVSVAVPDIVSLNSGCHKSLGEPASCCSEIFCGRVGTCQMAVPLCDEHVARFYSTRQNLPVDIPYHLAVEQDIPYALYSAKGRPLVEPNQDKGLETYNKLISEYNNTIIGAKEAAYTPSWSCCLQFVVRREALLKYNKSFYTKAYELFITEGVATAKGLEWSLYHLFDAGVPLAKLYDWYTSTDIMMHQIHGCPVRRRSIWP